MLKSVHDTSVRHVYEQKYVTQLRLTRCTDPDAGSREARFKFGIQSLVSMVTEPDHQSQLLSERACFGKTVIIVREQSNARDFC